VGGWKGRKHVRKGKEKRPRRHKGKKERRNGEKEQQMPGRVEGGYMLEPLL
jgi:hypothetical protein